MRDSMQALYPQPVGGGVNRITPAPTPVRNGGLLLLGLAPHRILCGSNRVRVAQESPSP